MADDTNQKVARERWAATAAAPFVPLQTLMGQGTIAQADQRAAYALEYIATQLGEINRKMAAKG